MLILKMQTCSDKMHAKKGLAKMPTPPTAQIFSDDIGADRSVWNNLFASLTGS
jgi:glutathione synthase/RimK-type ligase-like ATP-grasp enzyme